MLNEKLIGKLNSKLGSLILHLKDLRVDKKRANQSFKEQMTACEEKIHAIAETLQSGDETMLANAFDQYEIEALNK